MDIKINIDKLKNLICSLSGYIDRIIIEKSFICDGYLDERIDIYVQPGSPAKSITIVNYGTKKIVFIRNDKKILNISFEEIDKYCKRYCNE